MINADKSIKVDGLEKSIVEKCKQRIIAIAVMFFVSFIVVNIKLIDVSKPLKAKEHFNNSSIKFNKRGNILDRNGNITNRFYVIANNKDPKGYIKAGNERVVEARLNDAEFFWNKNKNQNLFKQVSKLKNINYFTRIKCRLGDCIGCYK